MFGAIAASAWLSSSCPSAPNWSSAPPRAAIDVLVQASRRGSADVHIIDLRAALPTSAMSDHTHLKGSSRAEFTRTFVQHLRALDPTRTR